MMKTHYIEELFYPGNKVQLEFYDEQSNKNSYATIVKSLEIERLYLMPVQPNDEIINQLKSGTEVTLVCQHNNGIEKQYFTGQVIQNSISERGLLILNRPNKIQINSSRRNFFRCDVELPFTYYLLEHEYQGKILNLSGCGLYGIIPPNSVLRPSMLIKGDFILPTLAQPLEFEGRVIRLEWLDHGLRQGVAFNFENITESWQNKIIKYLFLRQRELIRQRNIKVYR